MTILEVPCLPRHSALPAPMSCSSNGGFALLGPSLWYPRASSSVLCCLPPFLCSMHVFHPQSSKQCRSQGMNKQWRCLKSHAMAGLSLLGSASAFSTLLQPFANAEAAHSVQGTLQLLPASWGHLHHIVTLSHHSLGAVILGQATPAQCLEGTRHRWWDPSSQGSTSATKG